MAQFLKVFSAWGKKDDKKEAYFTAFRKRWEKLCSHPKGKPWLVGINKKYGDGFGLIRVQHVKGLAGYKTKGLFEDGIPLEMVFTVSHVLLCDQQFKPGAVINAFQQMNVENPRVDFMYGENLIFNYKGDKIVLSTGKDLNAVPVMEVMKAMLASPGRFPAGVEPLKIEDNPKVSGSKKTQLDGEVTKGSDKPLPNKKKSKRPQNTLSDVKPTKAGNSKVEEPSVSRPAEDTFYFCDDSRAVKGPASVGEILSLKIQGQLGSSIVLTPDSTGNWLPLDQYVHESDIQIYLKSTCCHCDRNISFPIEMAGKKIRCPDCKAVISLSDNCELSNENQVAMYYKRRGKYFGPCSMELIKDGFKQKYFDSSDTVLNGENGKWYPAINYIKAQQKD